MAAKADNTSWILLLAIGIGVAVVLGKKAATTPSAATFAASTNGELTDTDVINGSNADPYKPVPDYSSPANPGWPIQEAPGGIPLHEWPVVTDDAGFTGCIPNPNGLGSICYQNGQPVAMTNVVPKPPIYEPPPASDVDDPTQPHRWDRGPMPPIRVLPPDLWTPPPTDYPPPIIYTVDEDLKYEKGNPAQPYVDDKYN